MAGEVKISVPVVDSCLFDYSGWHEATGLKNYNENSQEGMTIASSQFYPTKDATEQPDLYSYPAVFPAETMMSIENTSQPEPNPYIPGSQQTVEPHTPIAESMDTESCPASPETNYFQFDQSTFNPQNNILPDLENLLGSESGTDAEFLDGLSTLMLPSIQRANELSIELRNDSSYADTTMDSKNCEGLPGKDWDISHQPSDQEPNMPEEIFDFLEAEKSCEMKKVTHDHCYGTHYDNLKKLNMNRDDDLQKGLDMALEEIGKQGFGQSFQEIERTVAKPAPKSVKDSQERLNNTMKNRRYLLRELRGVNGFSDIKRLGTDRLRQLVPRLVRYLYYQQDDVARKGIYKVAPPNWPPNKFFGDPCNRIADGGRPRKEMIIEMSCELFTQYQRMQKNVGSAVNAQPVEN